MNRTETASSNGTASIDTIPLPAQLVMATYQYLNERPRKEVNQLAAAYERELQAVQAKLQADRDAANMRAVPDDEEAAEPKAEG